MDTIEKNELIEKAISLLGCQQSLAKAVGVSQPTVNRWLNKGYLVTVERAIQIERVTKGEIRKEQLRPDFFSVSANDSAMTEEVQQ